MIYDDYCWVWQGKKVDVVAVMSDTTSTLLAGNYLDKQVRIGVILGDYGYSCCQLIIIIIFSEGDCCIL